MATGMPRSAHVLRSDQGADDAAESRRIGACAVGPRRCVPSRAVVL
jgi:hypothetical protein